MKHAIINRIIRHDLREPIALGVVVLRFSVRPVALISSAYGLYEVSNA